MLSRYSTFICLWLVLTGLLPGQMLINPYRFNGGPPPGPASIAFDGFDTSALESGFRSQVSTDNSNWTTMGSLGPLSGTGLPVSQTITNFPYNTFYWARLVAWNGVGESIVGSPKQVYTAPSLPPTALTATVVSDVAVSVSFTRPAVLPLNGGYQLSYSTNNGASWQDVDKITDSALSSDVVTDLTGSTTYIFRIRTVNSNFDSDTLAGSQWSASSAPVTTNETFYTYQEYREFIGGLAARYQMDDVPVAGETRLYEDVRSVDNGIYSGTFTTGVTGIPGATGTAVAFNSGAVTSGAAGNTSPLGQISNLSEFTMSCWAKWTSSANNRVLLEIGSNIDPKGPSIRTTSANGNLITFRFTDNAGTTVAELFTTGARNDNQWHMLAMTWDGSVIRGYIDGVLAATSSPITLSVEIATQRVGIARQSRGSIGTTFFTGTIDMVEVGTTALTASQLLSQYNRGIATIP